MSAFWAFSVRSVAGSGEIELVESNTVGISPPIGFSLRDTSRLSVFVEETTLNSYKVSRFFHFSWFCISRLEFALRACGGEDGSYYSMNIGNERWREDYCKHEQGLNLANISTRASENVYMWCMRWGGVCAMFVMCQIAIQIIAHWTNHVLCLWMIIQNLYLCKYKTRKCTTQAAYTSYSLIMWCWDSN